MHSFRKLARLCGKLALLSFAGVSLAGLVSCAGHFKVSESVPLNMPYAATSTAHDGMPFIASDGNEGWLIVWQSNETMGGKLGEQPPPGVVTGGFNIFAVRSTDGGKSWSDTFLLNSDGRDDGRHDVNAVAAGAPNGTWVVSWWAGGSIMAARSTDRGETWSAPMRIGAGVFPDITTDGKGNWVVTMATRDKRVTVCRSTDDGVTWQAEVELSPGPMVYFPQVETDGKGNWVVAWADAMMMAARSTDNGASWSAPVELGVVAEERLDLCVDGGGVFIAATSAAIPWPGKSTFETDAVGIRSTDGGRSWSEPFALHSDASDDNALDQRPRLAADAKGRWLALWYAQNRQTGEDNDMYFATSEDHGQTWSEPLPFNSYAASDSGSDAYGGVACDGKGNWIGVWNSNFSFDGKANVTGGNVIAGRARW